MLVLLQLLLLAAMFCLQVDLIDIHTCLLTQQVRCTDSNSCIYIMKYMHPLIASSRGLPHKIYGLETSKRVMAVSVSYILK